MLGGLIQEAYQPTKKENNLSMVGQIYNLSTQKSGKGNS